MAQMSGMLERFQAQVCDLTAMVSIDRSFTPRPVDSSMVTSVPVVRPRPRLVASSVETEVSTVRPQPTGAKEEDEVTPSGQDFSSSSPESTVRQPLVPSLWCPLALWMNGGER